MDTGPGSGSDAGADSGFGSGRGSRADVGSAPGSGSGPGFAGPVVTVGPGVLVAGLADRLARDGLHVPVGWCPSVGVVGAALGGGYGVFGRRHGLASDHVVGADVVLADGRLARVDAEHDPDLLWALRGAGGGQFAVVTALRLRPRRVEPATTFALTWRHEHAADVIDAWQRWAPTAPDTLNAELVVAASGVPGTVPLVVVFGVVVGTGAPGPAAATAEATTDATPGAMPATDAAATAALAELTRAVGAPSWRHAVRLAPGADVVRSHTFAGVPADATPMAAPLDGATPGRRVLRSHFVDRALPRSVIEELVASVAEDRVEGEYREIELVPWGGALARVAPDATAFAHRDPLFLVECNGDVQPGADEAARRGVGGRVARAWEAVRPHATGTAYPNYPDPEVADWPAASLGANLDRAAAVKAAYDPDDVFRHAQSVRPAAGARDRG